MQSQVTRHLTHLVFVRMFLQCNLLKSPSNFSFGRIFFNAKELVITATLTTENFQICDNYYSNLFGPHFHTIENLLFLFIQLPLYCTFSVKSIQAIIILSNISNNLYPTNNYSKHNSFISYFEHNPSVNAAALASY